MPKIPIVGNALPNEDEEKKVPLRVEEYFAKEGSAPPTVDDQFRKDVDGMNMEFEVD